MSPSETKMERAVKPLGRKNYGSIGHLPGSRLGPGDHHVPEGQGRIATTKVRDRRDRVLVQEKVDGSNVGVALVGGHLLALSRSGHLAQQSRYPQHQWFAAWVRQHEDRFRAVLHEGERLCGEWLAQAHGILYTLGDREPFAAFDLMRDDVRLPFDAFTARLAGRFDTPTLLHDGGALSVADAMALHAVHGWPGDCREGLIYRVERDGVVDFLAKHVDAAFQPGRYLPAIGGGDALYHWQPSPLLSRPEHG